MAGSGRGRGYRGPEGCGLSVMEAGEGMRETSALARGPGAGRDPDLLSTVTSTGRSRGRKFFLFP